MLEQEIYQKPQGDNDYQYHGKVSQGQVQHMEAIGDRKLTLCYFCHSVYPFVLQNLALVPFFECHPGRAVD
jgi:hypothetical protein